MKGGGAEQKVGKETAEQTRDAYVVGCIVGAYSRTTSIFVILDTHRCWVNIDLDSVEVQEDRRREGKGKCADGGGGRR